MVAKRRDLGEACTAVNRIYLHASVETQFVEKFTAGLATLKITDGLDPSVGVGRWSMSRPVIRLRHLLTMLCRGSLSKNCAAYVRMIKNFYPPKRC